MSDTGILPPRDRNPQSAARPERTEPVLVCVDADVLIAGLLSRTGASHAILVLGELGLLRLVLPETAVAE
ncbi:MAG: hypothetical protein ACREKQ_14375, partial [Candidatus Rokuibacteriota bacterium]